MTPFLTWLVLYLAVNVIFCNVGWYLYAARISRFDESERAMTSLQYFVYRMLDGDGRRRHALQLAKSPTLPPYAYPVRLKLRGSLPTLLFGVPILCVAAMKFIAQRLERALTVLCDSVQNRFGEEE